MPPLLRFPRVSSQPFRSSQPVVALISLGCSKNTVDSEHILAHLAERGFLIAEDAAEADICLVNTCGFIESARQETASVLRHLRNSARDQNNPPLIVALGCMVERARQSPEMRTYLDAADAMVLFGDYARLPDICHELLARKRCGLPIVKPIPMPPALYHPPSLTFLSFLTGTPRMRIGSSHIAYLKISEGCSNRCRFCSIPLIRGTQSSRTMKDIVSEAQQLIETGARELNLIAQDTTTYGKDRGLQNGLANLLEKLADINGDVWYRVLYGHPRHVTDKLLRVMADTPNVCPYLDIPLQHISDRMLRAMGRGMTQSQTMACLEKVQRILPNIALRTTFIVGYPGETDEDFNKLLNLVAQGLFAHVGVFTFSPEPGTPAARLPDNVPPSVKERRRNEIMLLQQRIRRRQLRHRRGQTMKVMLDEVVASKPSHSDYPQGTRGVGRTIFDAPEVDGAVYIRGPLPSREPGSRFLIQVVDSTDYDLIGEAVRVAR
jgi:ribosomal protein S12 methylthiotransferase